MLSCFMFCRSRQLYEHLSFIVAYRTFVFISVDFRHFFFYMHFHASIFVVRVQGSCPCFPIFLLPSCMPFIVLGCCLQTCAFPPGAISFLFFSYAGHLGMNWRARGRYCGCRRTPQYLAPLRWHDWSVSTDVAGWSL